MPESLEVVRISVLMTTFNRPEATRSVLEKLTLAAQTLPRTELMIYIADASTDGRTKALARGFHNVQYEAVSSDTYWAQGMRSAWESAQLSRSSFLLWLNDDVDLDLDAIARLLLASEEQHAKAIIVGGTRHPVDGSTTYSGYITGRSLNRLNMTLVEPARVPQRCDAFNGNVVLIPTAIDGLLGGFPQGYIHSLADLAYGLSARRRGVEIYLAPGSFGTCARNSEVGTWKDKSLPRRDRLRDLAGPKGLTPGPWFRFCWTYGNAFSLLAAAKPYVLIGTGAGIDWIASRFQRRRQAKT